MGFLTIKQEPVEWSELASTENIGRAASALLLDAKAHIELTVKPEIFYPDNDDSCEVPSGECTENLFTIIFVLVYYVNFIWNIES